MSVKMARPGSDEAKLLEAAKKGDVNEITTLLEKGADINAVDSNGNSALRISFIHYKYYAFELLLEKGADVNSYNKFNSTVLQSAVMRQNLAAVKVLLDNGANVNAVFGLDDLETPLDRAIANKVGEEIIALLREKGAKRYAETKGGNNLGRAGGSVAGPSNQGASSQVPRLDNNRSGSNIPVPQGCYQKSVQGSSHNRVL